MESLVTDLYPKRKTQLLPAPGIPWAVLAGFVVVAGMLLLASVKIVERREF